MLGFNKEMFQKMYMPGAVVGNLTDEVKEMVGYDCQVVLPPTHDTASAVMAVPSNDENVCYISSGTWSLMGVERDEELSRRRFRIFLHLVSAEFIMKVIGNHQHRCRFFHIFGMLLFDRHQLIDRIKDRFLDACSFWNGMDDIDGTLCWDVDRLFKEIIEGMKKCREIGKIPESVGIDTWGVDFVLLDKDDKMLGQAVGYRDHRTDGMDEEVYKIIKEDDLYARTGIKYFPIMKPYSFRNLLKIYRIFFPETLHISCHNQHIGFYCL